MKSWRGFDWDMVTVKMKVDCHHVIVGKEWKKSCWSCGRNSMQILTITRHGSEILHSHVTTLVQDQEPDQDHNCIVFPWFRGWLDWLVDTDERDSSDNRDEQCKWWFVKIDRISRCVLSEKESVENRAMLAQEHSLHVERCPWQDDVEVKWQYHDCSTEMDEEQNQVRE
jgi:hypothetical protein